ncbi:MAG: Dual specificity phosphatase, catalytic domain [Planctomycetes bacterium ADurb.Bin412]|nr:MAG: Dual specificity phosphatase, catalytic domain [Planctomycetes bacterium ADurb.Bin412]
MKTDCPPSAQQIESFLRMTQDSQNQPILIHCAQGVVRTNMMVAVFLKQYYDMDNHKIMKMLPFFGHRLEKRPRVHDFIKNYSKTAS